MKHLELWDFQNYQISKITYNDDETKLIIEKLKKLVPILEAVINEITDIDKIEIKFFWGSDDFYVLKEKIGLSILDWRFFPTYP